MTKVGIVGAGGMGNVHSRKYAQMPDVEVRFFEMDETRRGEFASRTHLTPVGSMDDLLGWADAIDICTPTPSHLPLASLAMTAGKAVLIEKPLVRTIEQGRELLELEAKTGGFAMAAEVVRFFPEYAAAHRTVKSGKLGNLGAARMRRGGRAPASPWFQDVEQSGGVILDVGVHEFDWLNWTIGPVKRVMARSARVSQPELPPPGDYALVTLEFENGCVGHVELTWLDPSGFRVSFEVTGSQGMVEFDSKNVAALRTITGPAPIQENPVSAIDDPYYKQLRAFVDGVQSGGAPAVSLREGLNAVAVACAALESAKTGEFARVQKF